MSIQISSKQIETATRELGNVLHNHPDLIKASAKTFGAETTRRALTIKAGTPPIEPAPVRKTTLTIKATEPPK